MLTATANTEKADALIRRKAQVFGTSVREEYRKEMALTIFDAVKTLPPVSNLSGTESFGAQRRIGVAAAGADVDAVYATSTEIFRDLVEVEGDADGARAFRKLARSNPSEAQALLRRFNHPAQGIPIGGFDPGVHRSARGRGGRVRARLPRMIVTDTRALSSYRKETVAKVGTLKKGFEQAYRAVGGKKSFPGWIRANRGRSRVDDRTKTKTPTLVATNLVPYGGFQDRRSGIIRIVMSRRRGKIKRAIAAGVKRKVRRG